MEKVIARILERPRSKKDPVRRLAISNVLRTPQEAKVVGPSAKAFIAVLDPVGVAETSAKPIDLRQATLQLLFTVREPSSAEQEALEKRGFSLFHIGNESLDQLIGKYPYHFWDVNDSQRLRRYTPPAMVVAMRPENLALSDSFKRSQIEQLAMIEEYAKSIREELPDAHAVMLPASAYAQADIAYMEETTQPLFSNFYARALDQTDGSSVADVGRNVPGDQLHIHDWGADYGFPYIGAVPAVVFLQK